MKTLNKVLSVILALILALPLNALSETYYIDPDGGNDANTGMSTAQAWRSFPGTTTPADYTVNKNSSWGNGSTLPSGAITTANRIPFGSVFKVKSGTTFSSADGIGQVYFRGSDSAGFYGMNSNAVTAYTGQGIIIERDTTWGSGNVTIDGTGLTPGIGSWVMMLDGALIDGKTTNGFTFVSNPLEGIQVKEYTSNSVTYFPKFINILNVLANANGLSLTNDDGGAGKAQINIRGASGLRMKNVRVVSSPTNFINGILLGDSAKRVTDGVLEDVYSTGHIGDQANNDSGLGAKALNSEITFINCVFENNLKGVDLGEQNSVEAWSMRYKFLNSTVASNSISGIGFNSSGSLTKTNVAFLWVVNSLIYSNATFGINTYSAPHQLVVAHSVFHRNGSAAPSGSFSGHIRAGFDSSSETDQSDVFIYNSLFFDHYDCVFTSKVANESTDTLTWLSDFNVYARSSTESYFHQWSHQGGDFANVGFGAPWSIGSTSGQWYLWEGVLSSANLSGDWHKNSDGNSVVLNVGNAENTLGTFFTIGHPTYSAGTPRAGDNLTSKAWYIPEMAFDRLGNARTLWTRGAYESSTPAPPPPVWVPLMKDCCGLPLAFQ